MTIGATASNSITSAATSVSAPGIETSPGDLVIIFGAATNDFAATPITETGGAGNTFTPINSTATGSGRFSRAWYSELVDGDANHVFTVNLGVSDFCEIFVVVVSSAADTPTVEGSGVRDDIGPPWDSNSLSPAYSCTLLGFNATSTGAGDDTITWSNAFVSGDKLSSIEITDADNRLTGSVAAAVKAAGTYTASSSSAVGTSSHVWIVAVEEGAGGPTNIYVSGIPQRNVRHTGRYM